MFKNLGTLKILVPKKHGNTEEIKSIKYVPHGMDRVAIYRQYNDLITALVFVLVLC